jgi:hypothetical protein
MQWPVEVPALTEEEAKRAVRKLHRFALGETWRGPVVITSGNRHTWIDGGTFRVNPSSWREMIRELSWLFFTLANPGMRRNPKDIERLEDKLIKEVTKRGWLANGLKTQEEPELLREVREHKELIKRLDAAVVRWEGKLVKAQRDIIRAKKGVIKARRERKKHP